MVKKFLRVEKYPNAGEGRKQSRFESDCKLMNPYEEYSFKKSIPQALMHFKQQLEKFE